MDSNRKLLIELRTELRFYKELDENIEKLMNAEIELEAYNERVFNKIEKLENELNVLKINMDLPEEEWDEDEI